MKSLTFVVVVFVLAAMAAAQEDHMRSMPNLVVKMEPANAPMAVLPLHQVTPNQLREETAQLDELVKSVEPKLQQASQGTLDKDLLNKLKAIEKLAKKLRSELNN